MLDSVVTFLEKRLRVIFPLSVIEAQEEKVYLSQAQNLLLRNFERGNIFDLKQSSLEKKNKKRKEKRGKKRLPHHEDASRKSSLGVSLISLTVFEKP